MILGVVFPAWPAARKWGFAEFARRPGDLALAGIALFYDLDAAGRPSGAHIAVIGATDLPMRLPAAEALLNGAGLDETSVAAIAQAAADSVDPPADIHASIAYRKSLVATLTGRALSHAMSR
jgi:carbon-monoxide dehydrogenase medium subunit